MNGPSCNLTAPTGDKAAMDPRGSTGRVAAVAEVGFRFASRLRRARTFHPRGVVLTGRADLGGDHPLLRAVLVSAATEVVVRLSRGLGLPGSFPDFNGVAVRFVDGLGPGASQDLLLVSSGNAPVLRHALWPVRRWDGVTYSSILPFEHAGALMMLGVSLHGDSGCTLSSLNDVEAAVTCGGAELRLFCSSVAGRWRTIGSVHLDGALEDDPAGLYFDPWNSSQGLRPWSWLNGLRIPAYRGSRKGRQRRPR